MAGVIHRKALPRAVPFVLLGAEVARYAPGEQQDKQITHLRPPLVDDAASIYFLPVRTGQPQLFYEDVFEVTRPQCRPRAGAKAVAKILWPHKPIIEAQRELLDCLNRERPQKLCIEEFMAVLRMAHDAGFHQAKHWIDEALGYQPTMPAGSEDRARPAGR
jgi:hypothetical protein